MQREQAIATLRSHEQELRQRGILHAALFGSVARNQATRDTDTDIMIDIDPAAPIGIYKYVRIKEYIAGLFEGPIDVVDRAGLKPYIRPAVISDAIRLLNLRRHAYS